MRNSTMLAVLAAVAAMPVQAAPPTAEQRQALEALASRADAAWNARDAATMGSYYTADGSIKLSGMASPVEGRAAIQAYFERAFAQRQGDMRHVTMLRKADMVAPNVVYTDSDVRVEMRKPDGGYSLVRAFENNSVAIREGGVWKLHALRANAVPQAK